MSRKVRPKDWGSASLEIAILGPVLLVLIFSIVQAGMWFYARNLALAAAQEGITFARTYTASPGARSGPDLAAGATRARSFITRQAGDSLVSPAVAASGTATQVRIEVTGRSLSVLPGVAGFTVRQVATGPVERFTTATP